MAEQLSPNVYIVAGPNGAGKSQLEGLNLPPIFAKAERAMKEAVAAAIAEHWRAGRPVHVWKNGRVVALYPDGRQVPQDEPQAGS